MLTSIRVCKILIFSFCSLLFFVDRAHAYIDPGTGSMILQATIAAIVGSAVTIKLLWQRIKLFFLRFVGKNKTENTDLKK